MKIKRAAIIGLAALVVTCSAFAVGTVTSNAMTYDQAMTIAKEHVPATAELVKSEKDWSKYEFKYRDDNSSSDYEVEVSKKKKMVTEVTMEYDREAGGSSAVLTEEEASAIAKEQFPDATIDKVNLNQDDNGYTYDIDFSGNGYYGDIDINAETGTVNEYELHFGTATVIPLDEESAEKDKVEDKSTPQDDTGETITEEEAKQIVLKQVPGATIDRVELDSDDGIQRYEITAHDSSTKYEFDIHAVTGVIIETDSELIAQDKDDDDWDDDQYDDYDDQDDWDDSDDDDYAAPSKSKTNNSTTVTYDDDDDWDDDDNDRDYDDDDDDNDNDRDYDDDDDDDDDEDDD